MIGDESKSEKSEFQAQARSQREWTTPSVKKLRAGSAEDGAGASPDAGINPS